MNKQPKFNDLVSQLATYKQTLEPIYGQWINDIKEHNFHNRKQWEYVYILQALKENGFLKDGISGLGFGVGSEPLPAVMAKYGCKVLATEINIEKKNEKGWVKGRDIETQIKELNSKGICNHEKFNQLVSFKDVDMNKIPSDLSDFDFTWSCCSLEHLGNMELCTDFIFNSLDCLKPGGVAIHTTEFTLSKKNTITKGSTVFFREQDIISIASRLTDSGHEISLNLHKGNHIRDWLIDIPPYKKKNHIKLLISKQWKFLVATSIGIIIKKNRN